MMKPHNFERLADYLSFQFTSTADQFNAEICPTKTVGNSGSEFFTTLTSLHECGRQVCLKSGWLDFIDGEKKVLTIAALNYIDAYFKCYNFAGVALCKSNGGHMVERYLYCQYLDSIIKDFE